MINTSKKRKGKEGKKKKFKSQNKIHQAQAPKYNLAPKKKKKKNSPYQHAYVLPLFVTNCQRAIMTHHQKVEAVE